jgi:hypothetical protein
MAGIRRAAVRAWVVVLGGLLVGAGAPGCARECSDANCGTGVTVWWRPDELPATSGYRLCVNDVCDAVTPAPIGGDGRYLAVAPPTGNADRDVSVTLELLDDDGTRIALLRGSGERTGRCCPGVELHPGTAGRLVVQSLQGG